MNNDYKQGYRDGWNDAKKNEGVFVEPKSPTACAVCSIDFGDAAYSYYCANPKCPKGFGGGAASGKQI